MQLILWISRRDEATQEFVYYRRIISREWPRVPVAGECIALDDHELEEGGHDLLVKLVAWGPEPTPHLWLGSASGLDLDVLGFTKDRVPLVVVDGITQADHDADEE